MEKGKIIVIEGTDGSGKYTQTNLLFQTLQQMGKNVILQSFPNYDSPSSMPVKMYLGGEFGDKANCLDAYQASTLYAVDRLCTMQKLLDHYNNGGILILDRYVSSNMLHQASKIDSNNDKDKFLEWLDNLEFNTLKLPRPDLTIFLDVKVEVSKALANARTSLKTNGSKDIHENDLDHLSKSYLAGKYVAKKYSWETIDCVDNNNQIKSIEQISQLVLDKVIHIL